MQPYLAQEQRMAGGHRMEAISFSRNDRRGFAARASLLLSVWKGYRRGRAAHARNPRGDRLLHQDVHHYAFALAINRNQIGPDASAQKYMPNGYTLRAEQLTPLELADFTSGMPDDPTNLPRGLEQRSIESYTVKDFLTWASNYEPRTQLPAPYKYSNAGIGLLSYLVATATGKTWEDQVNSEILQPLGMADTTLRPTPEQQNRLAQGHNRAGQNAPRWPVFASYLPVDCAQRHTI